MLNYLKLILLLSNIILTICEDSNELNTKGPTITSFMIWPNATVPFYIDPQHFDSEQSLQIMTALADFAYHTCLKFAPVMDRPSSNQHVLVFVNPEGLRRCDIDMKGHSVFKPHTVLLGYDCLKSPQIDMMIMRSLGMPFEHNRLSRDLYIDVMLENVEPGAVELFTKDNALPPELRALPYDHDSVMHFGEREHSKNGHRTIRFKNENLVQHRSGLSKTDLKKIDIVYGPECRNRDRQEKIELCQSYPGVARRKREAETPSTQKSLRVNRNITPPVSVAEGKENEKSKKEEEKKVSASLKELGIDDEAQGIIDHVYKISSKALKHAREKYCNTTNKEEISFTKLERRGNSDILGILESMSEYARNMVENALSNLTIFCEDAASIDTYQRQCNWRFDNRCPPTYWSTKSGPVRYSTNHRPYIIQSTKHRGQAASYSYDKVAWRSRNDSSEMTTPQIQSRRKRDAPEKKISVSKDKLDKEKKIVEDKLRAKENSTKDGLEGKRRFFESRRYKSKKSAEKSGDEWVESDISEEKEENKRVSKEIEIAAVKEPLIGYEPKDEEVQKPENIEEDITVVKEEVVEKETENKGERDLSVETPRPKAKKHKGKDFSKIRIKDTFEIMDERKKDYERREKPKKKKGRSANVPKTLKMSKANREFYNERMWPEGVVRYVITPLAAYDLDDLRGRLSVVADILKKQTCVRLEEVTEDEAQNYEDYLILDTSADYVTGRVGGAQHFGSIELFQGGQHKQHTAMMVMAMLGFYFEVARHDRDKHIRVHMRHVRPDKLHHFEKIRDDATFSMPYDYKSATHPAWQFWRKVGKTGIATVATFKEQDPDGSVMRALGQHDQLLSHFDIIKINSVYGVECFEDSSP